MLVEPRWWNTLVRNRPTSGTEYAKSISPCCSNRSRRLAGTIASAIAFVSANVSGSRSKRTRPFGIRYIGGDPTFTWRSEPSLFNSPASHPLNSSTIGSVTPSTKPSLPSRVRRRRSGSPLSHRPGNGPTSVPPRRKSFRRCGQERSALQAPRATRRQTADRSASGSNSVRRSEGRDAPEHALQQPSVHGADQLPVLVEQIAEGAVAERDLDGLRAAASEPRIEPGLGERLLEDGEVRAGRAAGARAGDAPPDQVRAPLARDGLRALALPLAVDQTRQDLAEQPVVAALPLLAVDGRVQDLRPPDGRAPVDLARRRGRPPPAGAGAGGGCSGAATGGWRARAPTPAGPTGRRYR